MLDPGLGPLGTAATGGLAGPRKVSSLQDDSRGLPPSLNMHIFSFYLIQLVVSLEKSPPALARLADEHRKSLVPA